MEILKYTASKSDVFWLNAFFGVNVAPRWRSTRVVTVETDRRPVQIGSTRMTFSIHPDSLPIMAVYSMTMIGLIFTASFDDSTHLFTSLWTVCAMLIVVPFQAVVIFFSRLAFSIACSDISQNFLVLVFRAKSFTTSDTSDNASTSFISQYVVMLNILVYCLSTWIALLLNRHILVVFFFKYVVFHLVPLISSAYESGIDVHFQDTLTIELIRSILLCFPVLYLGENSHFWWMIHFIFLDFLETTFAIREMRLEMNENLS